MSEQQWKPTKGWLQGKQIPKDKNGDPAFEVLGCEKGEYDLSSPTSVLAQFTAEQVVYLVNKQLYALEYQKETHKKRAAEEREVLKPIKEKVKQLFGVSFIKATEEQLEQAAEAVRKERDTDET